LRRQETIRHSGSGESITKVDMVSRRKFVFPTGLWRVVAVSLAFWERREEGPGLVGNGIAKKMW